MTNVSAVQARSRDSSNIDHTETLGRLVSAITLFNPIKTIIGYLIPWMAAWGGKYAEIEKANRLQGAFLDQDSILTLVNDLKLAAGISRKVTTYASLYYSCLSYGGRCSFSSPILSIPLSFLRNNQLGNPEELEADHWKFNRDEVSFFIARELAHIKSNDALYRIASKVLFLAAIFFVFSMPATWMIAGLLILGSSLLYLISERFVHGKLDIQAINILTTYFGGDHEKAVRVGCSALQKLIDQNKERKEQNRWLKSFYLTKAGNNLLDLGHPLLTNRLNRVQTHFQNALTPILDMP